MSTQIENPVLETIGAITAASLERSDLPADRVAGDAVLTIRGITFSP